MSLNGSGVFNVNSAGLPVVAGTLITSATFNAYTADVAAALSTALYSDGQRVNAANQNMGGFKLTGLAAGASPGESVRYEQAALLAGGNMAGALNGKLTTVGSHATTADIFATTVGNLIDWTGTATTTAFAAAPQAGAERTLICADAAVFTAGADMLIDGLASGQSYTATAGDKVIVRAVTTTRFRLTVQPYSTAVFPLPGTVLQVAHSTDAGSSTAAAALTSVTSAAQQITPKSSNSTFIVECDFQASVAQGGAGTNTTGNFRLYNNTAAADVGLAEVTVGVVSLDGTNVSTRGAYRCVAQVGNAALTPVGFILKARYGSVACTVSATNQAWKITEVQN